MLVRSRPDHARRAVNVCLGLLIVPSLAPWLPSSFGSELGLILAPTILLTAALLAAWWTPAKRGGLASEKLALGCALWSAVLASSGVRFDISQCFFGLMAGAIVGILCWLAIEFLWALLDPILNRIRGFIPSRCCRHRGYDLRGNSTTTCPECGRENILLSTSSREGSLPRL